METAPLPTTMHQLQRFATQDTDPRHGENRLQWQEVRPRSHTIAYLPAYRDYSPTNSARFPVTPRAEEGKEKLPSYSAAVQKSAILPQKMELLAPSTRSPDRRWKYVQVVLDSTMLSIYSLGQQPSIFHRNVVLARDGELLKCYTLQHAEIGLATDYPKRPFSLRIRAESDQFLLCCGDGVVVQEWLEALQAGANLSLPLDDRMLPTFRTLPRGRGRLTVIVVPSVPSAPPTTTTSPLPRPTSTIAVGVQQTVEPDKRQVAVVEVSDVAFARRCLSTLRQNSPRQCPFLIHDGRRMRILPGGALESI